MAEDQDDGFKPLKMVMNPPGIEKPAGASSMYLEREDGTGFWITHGVTDKADGLTDADFDFPAPSGDDE